MKHLGDITAIDWAEVEPVDCVTGGSPCQDLSVAGKRAGLAGERSGLFMEQIRCVKELREADESRGRTGAMVRPRFMVWENVPGAFSSNGGKDFAAVLEETVKVVEPKAPAVCANDGKWPGSGCLYDDMGRWSVAWRVHDAQFWGVPQRRKRIALVADFGGLAAPEILFERKGLSRDFESGETAREEAAGAVGKGTESAEPIPINTMVVAFAQNQRNEVRDLKDIAGALAAEPGMKQQTYVCAGFDHNTGAKAGNIGYEQEKAPTLTAQKQMAVLSVQQNASGEVRQSEVGYTLSTNGNASGRNAALCYDARSIGNGQLNQISMGEQANTLNTMHDQQCVLVCGLDSNKNGYVEQTGALQAHTSGGSTEFCSDKRNIVRRLTPLECERLQGYPDGWTDIGDWTDSKGKRHKAADSPRYKALGNSIALPFWFWLLRRISAQYERPATLGSLFDGIGGFPLCWERCNGPKTARWASEIEEFPMAVTRVRFKEENYGT